MKATTKMQAERMAKAGAAQMAGYTFAPYQGHTYTVTKAGQEEMPYYTSVEANACTCEFFRQNAEFGTCKHLEWLKGELEAEAWWAATAEEAEFARYELADAKF